MHQNFQVVDSILHPIMIIGGSVFTGIMFGSFFNRLCYVVDRESEGSLIVLVLAFISLCYGLAGYWNFDELMATMVMGAWVVNFNRSHEKIFQILERYTEELIFVLFFTISGMHLQFDVLVGNLAIVMLFIVLRIIGKVVGTVAGASMAKASPKVRKWTAGGLLPQGGIVIGLALLIHQNSDFNSLSAILLSVILGTTVINELIGPVVSKFSLSRAGEIFVKK